ncbi:hypothetical protein B0F90DRAFT_1824853 [Multifurca ochricompacta]|uniref:Uncharacterized protein n=1 Tax=Multifurca ochricompacta TaxID=376703 RepID=A0AAD4LUI3_9AGAM|nr:hypothetical protein B0F90DRAFT_1824853 [Multifurca ochricompacta]
MLDYNWEIAVADGATSQELGILSHPDFQGGPQDPIPVSSASSGDSVVLLLAPGTPQVSPPPPYQIPPSAGDPELAYHVPNPLGVPPDIPPFDSHRVLNNPMALDPLDTWDLPAHLDEAHVVESQNNLAALRQATTNLSESLAVHSLYYWSMDLNTLDDSDLGFDSDYATRAALMVAAMLGCGAHQPTESYISRSGLASLPRCSGALSPHIHTLTGESETPFIDAVSIGRSLPVPTTPAEHIFMMAQELVGHFAPTNTSSRMEHFDTLLAAARPEVEALASAQSTRRANLRSLRLPAACPRPFGTPSPPPHAGAPVPPPASTAPSTSGQSDMADCSPSPPLRARKSSILDGSRALRDPANFGTDTSIHKPEEDALLPSSTPAPPQRPLPPPPTPTTPDVLEVILNKLTLITDRIAVLEAKTMAQQLKALTFVQAATKAQGHIMVGKPAASAPKPSTFLAHAPQRANMTEMLILLPALLAGTLSCRMVPVPELTLQARQAIQCVAPMRATSSSHSQVMYRLANFGLPHSASGIALCEPEPD